MIRIYLLLIITAFAIIILPACDEKQDYKALPVVQKMTLQHKIGQMLMMGVPDKKINNDTVSIIKKYLPGGIILFGYNLGDSGELKKYIQDMQKAAFEEYNIPLFISIDQEGGRVRRIQAEVTQFPGNMAFGIVNDRKITYEAARILGIELRNIGVNMNLAPVLDVNNNPMNPVINTRSFASDAEIVSVLGAAYITGLQKSGCIAVGKHFPGHGDTDKDSHLTLPVIRYDMERLNKVEFLPFAAAVKNEVEAIMTAHISFPEILKDNSSATVSKKFLTDVLREEIHFKGIIITDDMEMNAIAGNLDQGEAAVKAIEAGADIILISTHGKSVDQSMKAIGKAVADGRIPVGRIDESVRKIVKLKLRYGILDVKDGKPVMPELAYGKDDLELLKKAGELNKRISGEAIYYYADNVQLELLTGDKPKIIISANDFFIKEIDGIGTNKKIFYSEMEFIKFAEKKVSVKNGLSELNNTYIFYQLDKTNPVLISRINAIARLSGSKLFLICTGNPFPLGNIKSLPPSLISFSNTAESIKQVIACLKGELKPKEKIPLLLGFPVNK